ncbi:hypothetical protein B0H13DRAFT_1880196 [Mycena leptocephala]|nr:hypothetical protein B0H13DRAFT_1880196 [Mycena leptocephala]
MTPIGARRRQPRPPGQNAPLKIMKGLLQYRQDAHGEDLAQGLIVRNIDDNETSVSKACLSVPSDLSHLRSIEEHHLQAALATSTVRIPIPGSVQLVANYTELYPSDRWLDRSTYVQSTETISEACCAALIDHDYTYYMDEADKKWLDDTNNGCCVEEPIVHERRARCTPILISADEFELVMGLFEILTGPKLRSQHQLSDFSFFQPFFQAPLHPDTFASHVVPAWVPPPSVLTSIAVIIHQHWQQRRSFRGGHKIFPLLNNDARDCINDAYVCFRNTPVHRTRSQCLKASGHGQIGWFRMKISDQRLANKHQSNPHIQTRTEKEPAYATEGITISPPSIKEKTEQNGNANHNSLKTASSIPQPVIRSENVKQRLISATTEQKRPEKLRMERRGTPSSTSVVRPRQRQPRAPQLPSMAPVVPEHQRPTAQVIDLELSVGNTIPAKRQRTQSARAGDAAAKPPPRRPGLSICLRYAPARAKQCIIQNNIPAYNFVQIESHTSRSKILTPAFFLDSWRKPGLRWTRRPEAINGRDGIGDRVKARIRGDERRQVVVAESKTREVVFGSEGAGDLGDVVYGRSEARGATACREHTIFVFELSSGCAEPAPQTAVSTTSLAFYIVPPPPPPSSWLLEIAAIFL